MVNKQMLENALEMTITDYVDDEDNITRDELNDVANRFLQLIKATLIPAVSEEEDGDDKDG